MMSLSSEEPTPGLRVEDLDAVGLIKGKDDCQIYLLKHKINNEYYVVKQYEVSTAFMAHKVKEQFSREKKASKLAKHQNLLEMLECYEKDKVYSIIFPKAECSLRELLTNKKKLKGKDNLIIFYQITEGLHFLHEQGVIHRDLKPENILSMKKEYEESEGLIKICDYEQSKFAPLIRTKNIGTTSYTAPEILKEIESSEPLDDHYTYKIDYWSLGTILYELTQGSRPWKDLEKKDLEKDLKDYIIKFDINKHDFKVILGAAAKNVVIGLLQQDPAKRFNYYQIQQSGIFQEIKYFKPLEEYSKAESMYRQEKYFRCKFKKSWPKKSYRKLVKVNSYEEFGMHKYDFEKLDKDKMNNFLKNCELEIQKSKKLEHDNVTPLDNYFFKNNQGQLVLMYKYEVTGTLDELLMQQEKLEEIDAYRVLKDLIEGANFLHENDLIHYHICPVNVNIINKYQGMPFFSLIGYGLSNDVPLKSPPDAEFLLYMPPEYFSNEKKKYNFDYWSIGILYYRLLTGKAPWNEHNPKIEEILEFVKNKLEDKESVAQETEENKSSESNEELSKESKLIIKKLLKIDPNDRLKYLDFKQSELFKKFSKKKGSEEKKNEPLLVESNEDD